MEQVTIAYKQYNIYFSQFWSLGCSRSRHRQVWCVVRAHFVLHRWLAVFPDLAERDKGLSYKDTRAFREGSTLMP